MYLAIAMIVAYLPILYWMYIEIRDGGKIDIRNPPKPKITLDKDDVL